jgi:dTDP-4-dehydrorhamnose 3,5-epimerase
VQIRELTIADAFEVTPIVRRDHRGDFLEWYRHDVLEEHVGHSLDLRQANTSVSKQGVLRGIHYADIPRGQAKYVTAVHGAVLDFVVDIRVGSPTFGEWDSVLLDNIEHKAVYLAEGLGHAFLALTPDATVSYLVSDTYNPQHERGVNPLDSYIGLDLPAEFDAALLADKDRDASGLEAARDAGVLPTWADAKAFYQSLNQKAS